MLISVHACCVIWHGNDAMPCHQDKVNPKTGQGRLLNFVGFLGRTGTQGAAAKRAPAKSLQVVPPARQNGPSAGPNQGQPTAAGNNWSCQVWNSKARCPWCLQPCGSNVDVAETILCCFPGVHIQARGCGSRFPRMCCMRHSHASHLKR